MKTARFAKKKIDSYFELIIDSLELLDWTDQLNISDVKVQNIARNFANLPSIIKIKQKLKLNKKFSVQCISEATVRKFLRNLLSDEATAGEIPVNVLKNSETCLFELRIFTRKKHPQMKLQWLRKV